MKIILDEGDALVVAMSLAKSRGLKFDFENDTYAPGSVWDSIYTEAVRVVKALRDKSSVGWCEHDNR